LRTISLERHLELAADLEKWDRARCLIDVETGASTSFLSRGSIAIYFQHPWAIIDLGAFWKPFEHSMMAEIVRWYRCYDIDI
jgi:hypothetical protein